MNINLNEILNRLYKINNSIMILYECLKDNNKILKIKYNILKLNTNKIKILNNNKINNKNKYLFI